MIKEYKEQEMLNTKHYFINMSDSSMKQTLYIMPNTNVRPKTWEGIANGKFFIINGQHNVATNKVMQMSSLSENIVKHFRKWNCFIVWFRNKSQLRQISGYHNRCNHFSIFKPMRATNILGARFIWAELGLSTLPKSTIELS
jgi:hypothetical protein